MWTYLKVLISAAAIIVFANEVKAASFSILSDLSDENYDYYPHDVSADGSVVVGDIGPQGPSPAFHLIIQSNDIEFVYRLNDQHLGREWTHGLGLSADGIVVVGLHDGSLFSPFYWTRNNGMVFLQNPASSNGYTTAASSDGSVIVGFSMPTPGLGQALRWTQNGDVTALDSFVGYEYSEAYDVSADGSVIVGESRNPRPNDCQAFRWTQSDGTVGLDFLPGDNASKAYAVSASGSVIVGWSKHIAEEPPYDVSHSEAFRWMESGMVGLGFLPGTDNSEAIDVSGDGSVVVGQSGDEPFIWDSINGMRSLEEVFIYDYNIDLSDYKITLVSAISADGGTMVGTGYPESEPFIGDTGYQNTKGWLANIDTSKGSLEVTIDPPEAVSTGAQWQINGGEWKKSGDSIIEIDPGDYALTFNEISGWKIPDTQKAKVTALSKNSVIATYTKVEYGALTVTIQPSIAVSIGAKWRVDVGEWRDSGYTEKNLETGNHRIEFKDVGGWSKPDNQTITIEDDQTTLITGTYIQPTGSLKVNIGPAAAVFARAKWRIPGGNWHNSGETINRLEIGNYWVEFIEIAGWRAPDFTSATITNGQTTTINGVYGKQKGSLFVSIEPFAAISAGAKWRINEGPWQNSGDVATGLDDGTYILEYQEVTGWMTPGSQSVTITNGESAVVAKGVYTKRGNGEDSDAGGGGCFIGVMSLI